jgi:glucose dehydrogenase
LADIEWQGQKRKVILWANRNGFFYMLDRQTGQFLLGKSFVEVTWASGFDQKGRPVRVPGQTSSLEGKEPRYSPRVFSANRNQSRFTMHWGRAPHFAMDITHGSSL